MASVWGANLQECLNEIMAAESGAKGRGRLPKRRRLRLLAMMAEEQEVGGKLDAPNRMASLWSSQERQIDRLQTSDVHFSCVR